MLSSSRPILVAVAIFWALVILLVGWQAVVVIASVCLIGFGALALPKGPTYGPPYREEVVGELYPQPKKKPVRRRKKAA